jgi:two-component system chemotaxis response regulator CheB
MGKIKVLLVDDSAVIRKVLGDVLKEDPEIEVIGTAANGKMALEQIAQLKPDIITLDIEMPVMDGLQTVQEIRKTGSAVPIIMCSSLTAAGASHTLDALAFGASDYVTKPSSHGANTRDVVGAELIKKIKGLARMTAAVPAPVQARPPASAVQAPVLGSIEAIAIGVSTGGPAALQEVLPLLPADLRVPILIVQHMPPVFTKLLAERLSGKTKMAVVEAQDGQDVVPGTIYLAPGGFHMEVNRRFGKVFTVLHEGPLENSCRPAVDVLFRSVAAAYGASSLAVMLTGMGQDGLIGCQRIKEVGGAVIAQDRDSSAVWGMPGAVVEAGLASSVLPLMEIASAMVGYATPVRRRPQSAADQRV